MSSPYTSLEFESLLDYLYNLQRLGIKVGLSHTRALLAKCGDPHNHFKSIHIAGTNGKGSTCAMMAAILREAGLKVGLYSSPHLIRFNERIQVDAKPICDEEIVSFIDQHRGHINEIKSTFFETTTAMAFDHFHKQNVDIAVIETGLGGRKDSTNVLKSNITVITPISMDHSDILGKDLLSIAREKAGIIKPNTPLFHAEQEKPVSHLLKKVAKLKQAPSSIIYNPEAIIIDRSGTSFHLDDKQYKTPLIGIHQAINGALAIAVVKTFIPNLDEGTIQRGLNKTRWPGRLQIVRNTPPILYDVAHNASGIRTVLNTIHAVYKCRPNGLFVLKGDKESDLIVEAIEGRFKSLVVSGGREYGLLTGNDLEKILLKKGLQSFDTNPNFVDALDNVCDYNDIRGRPTLIFGSHYVAKEIFDKFGFFI